MAVALKLTYPSYDKVEELIRTDLSIDIWSEHSVCNYICMKEIFNNYNDEGLVKMIGEDINARGGFESLQANFYILCRVLRHLISENPEVDPKVRPRCISIRDNVRAYWDGVGNWLG